jgi:hypothetical protein
MHASRRGFVAGINYRIRFIKGTCALVLSYRVPVGKR